MFLLLWCSTARDVLNIDTYEIWKWFYLSIETFQFQGRLSVHSNFRINRHRRYQRSTWRQKPASWWWSSDLSALERWHLDDNRGQWHHCLLSFQSSILSALLGELPPSSGTLSVRGSIAYVPQDAWVFSASLRQNVLFGTAYDPRKYQRAIAASALKKVRNKLGLDSLTRQQ